MTDYLDRQIGVDEIADVFGRGADPGGAALPFRGGSFGVIVESARHGEPRAAVPMPYLEAERLG